MQILQTIFLKKGKWCSLMLLTMFFAFFVLNNSAFPQVTTQWEFSQGTGTLPGYFGSGTERGIAYGTIGGQPRLLLSSQTPRILVIDPANGDTLSSVNMTNVTGGTLALADVEVSNDGIVFAGNLATNASTTAWKLYKWTDITAAPTVYEFTTTYAARLGDKFTVVGSASDNSLTIFAAHGSTTSTHPHFILKLTTTDNGATFTATEINVPGYVPGSTASVAPVNNGADGFYTNGNGQPIRKFDAAGNYVTAVNQNLVLGTGSNAIRYFTHNSRKYLVFYHNGPAITGTTTVGFYERARIIDVTDSDSLPVAVAATPHLGSATNTNGTGDVAIKDNGNGTFTVYVLASNNGIGAYTIDPAEFKQTLPVGTVVDFNAYWLPDNWRRFTGYIQQSPITLTEATTIWVVDDFGNVVTSPVNRSAKINIYGTTRNHWLVSPSINIPSTDATYKLEFDLALTAFGNTNPDSLGVDDTLAVVISTDNGATWDTSKILKLWKFGDVISNTGEQVNIELTGYSGLVKFGFYGSSTLSNKDVDVFIDNFAVKEVTTSQVDWCNLQWPATHTMTAGEQVTVYAQAWINGVTQTPGATPGLDAWIGISSENTNPNTWTMWVPAVFNTDVGNNDEFMAQIGATLPEGTYYYASRWQYSNGPFTYGGYNSGGGGFWDGINNVSGVLTITPYTVSSYPYSQGFEDTQFPPLGWSVEDLNAGNTWVRGTTNPNTGVGHARYPYSTTLPADDYLFTPGLNLTQGTVYTITYSYRCYSATYPENMAVTIGTAPNFAGVSDTLADHPGFVNNTYLTNTVMFSPDSTGMYYVGFHAYSAANMWDIFLDDIVIDILPEYNTVWERSSATTTLPAWFGTHTERGMAFGFTDASETNPRIYVGSRNGGTIVKILDANTGVDIGDLNTAGVSGGTYHLNDIEVSSDGKIFTANLTINASTDTFRVYMWANEAALAVPVIKWLGTDAVRLGDKFTVVGDYSAGTAVLYAASATANQYKVYKWTMTGGTFNQTPETIVLSGITAGTPSSASVGPALNGTFYWKATGFGLFKFNPDGSLIGEVPTTVVASGGNAVRFIGSIGNNEYVAVFQYGSTTENARILEIPFDNVPGATTHFMTPQLGSVANTNGSGDVAYRFYPDGKADIFVLSTNNGIGCYQTTGVIPVELLSFAAQTEENNVLINWSTATESNSQEFQIERKAADQNNWSLVGKVTSAGTSTEIREYSYTDRNVNSGKYSYRLKMVDFDGTFEYSQTINVEVGSPINFALSQNYPNPFNPMTRIDYQLANDSKVTVELFDITGQKVATLINEDMKAGYYSVNLNSGSYKLSTGVYIYRMIAIDNVTGKSFVDSKKLMLLK